MQDRPLASAEGFSSSTVLPCEDAWASLACFYFVRVYMAEDLISKSSYVAWPKHQFNKFNVSDCYRSRNIVTVLFLAVQSLKLVPRALPCVQDTIVMPSRRLLLVCGTAAALIVAPTARRRSIARRAAEEEDDDPYLSPRSRLAGYVSARRPSFRRDVPMASRRAPYALDATRHAGFERWHGARLLVAAQRY